MTRKQTENSTKEMSSKKNDENIPDNIFMLSNILPDVTSCFEDEPKRIEDCLTIANIVLDTNTLLLPYTSGASSLSKIAQIYEKIVELKRLYIPEQVAREFVKNRPTQLANLYSGISDKISKINVPAPFEPAILDSIKDFKELNISLEKLKREKKKLNELADKIKNEIKGWGWNDPVSQAYRPIFKKETIIKLDETNENKKDSIVEEMRNRYKCLIPPGYKDSAKNDEGIGDYLIWKTILQLGKHNNCPTIFVSGDEKADWFHRVNDKGFLPRYELEAEYRQVSKGHDLYIIPLSKLLELMDAEKSLVDEIKKEERQSQNDASLIKTNKKSIISQWVNSTQHEIELFDKKNDNENSINSRHYNIDEALKVMDIYFFQDEIKCPMCDIEDTVLVNIKDYIHEHKCQFCNVKFKFIRFPSGKKKYLF